MGEHSHELLGLAALAYFAGSRTAMTEPLPAPSVDAVPLPPPAATTPIPKTPNPAISSPAPAQPSLPAPVADKPPNLDERLAASEEWLKSVPDTHYFIQLLSVDGGKQRDVEAFLEENTTALDPQNVRVYRSKLSGRDRLGVIYGDYPTPEAANAELAALAKTSPTSNPYIRSVRKLR